MREFTPDSKIMGTENKNGPGVSELLTAQPHTQGHTSSKKPHLILPKQSTNWETNIQIHAPMRAIITQNHHTFHAEYPSKIEHLFQRSKNIITQKLQLECHNNVLVIKKRGTHPKCHPIDDYVNTLAHLHWNYTYQ